MKYKIAIVGATGVVGRTVLKIMTERKLLKNDLLLYASKKSAGRRIKIENRFFIVKELNESIFNQKVDFALFCTKEDISKQYVKLLAQKGTRVVDFSSLYRKRYPLVVPEINKNDIKGNIICNPNCSTIGAVMAIYNIHKKYGLNRIVYSTYQAVSGAGKDALDDLQKPGDQLKSFVFPIKNNMIPYIGALDENGYSKEENKMIYETRKILHDKNIKITATCVRVPIEVCHGESINFETKKRIGVKKIKKILKQTQGVVYQDEFPKFPMPILVRDQDNVFVGRLRKDFSNPNTFNIFVVSDNLRKGAAQNGVQILEEMIKQREKR